MMNNILKKMDVFLDEEVQYLLELNMNSYKMNDYIGKKIKIEWNKVVICHCGRKMDKFYRSSFCYNCYWESPLASQSIYKPELCKAHLGIEERDLNWEKKFQLAPHYVYLANSSGIKVGITRSTQKNIRWMDQGASQAILLAEVPNRRFSGDIEVILKRFVNDITNWRKMLSGEPEMIDMANIKEELLQHIPNMYQKYIIKENSVTNIKYPVKQYPKKIKSVRLDNNPIIEGELRGIKGQYLLLDGDRVFNVRSHEGYVVDFSYQKNIQESLF